MFLLRRYSAAVLAAAALTLGACSGETAPTAPEGPGEIDLAHDPLLIGLNPGFMLFEGSMATAPGPQTLGVNGLVAIGSAVEFGTPWYWPTGPSWVDVDPRPTFSREPLEWRHQVSIDQAAYATLANGVYQAQVPVIVRAARNTPQTLNVFMCKGTSACLTIGSDVIDFHGFAGDPTWQRGSNLNAPGAFFYRDYFVSIPAGTTAHVTMQGSSCVAGFTHSDPYLYAFDMNGNLVDFDDDGLCGLNSYLPLSNPTGSPIVRLLRTTSFSAGQGGTYRLRVLAGVPVLREAPPAPSADELEIIRQKALSGRN